MKADENADCAVPGCDFFWGGLETLKCIKKTRISVGSRFSHHQPLTAKGVRRAVEALRLPRRPSRVKQWQPGSEGDVKKASEALIVHWYEGKGNVLTTVQYIPTVVNQNMLRLLVDTDAAAT
jgi:hypothetical protein